MTKDCLVILGDESWKFMINEKFVATAHPQCYATVPIAYAFSHYMIESQSDNEILLQINIKNLLAAFRSVQGFSGGMTILKLTKKNNIALLSFEMWQDDGNELKVNVIQDVSVKPIQHSKLYLYEEPALGEYHGSAILPKLKSIKTVIERMRIIISNSNSSERANLYINNNDGRLLLETKTDHCSLKTIYNGLSVDNRQLHEDQSSNARRNENIKANIDLKYLLKVIQALNPLSIKSTIIAITKRTCVTIHAHLLTHGANNINRNDDDDDSSLSRITFYLCVYLDDDDDSDDDEDEDEEDEDEDDEKTMDATNDSETNTDTNDNDID
eukprot:CAMPEP_0201566270 /NCGR_PEP_ID=MMETSP0190_2-20130828/5953_1 /ASSEMBLY_ACC=CAM_ASM_000263 /TAXON_ID=37353 /ORGANISM="Rosalina sp." /LENGTH=326 /DNA_ID=CAMNT_0047984767 /DNA_START=118 /DNA_END=1098 /DNA_ORIENTATION=-